MLDLTPVCEFSRTYCAAICAVLVPVNLLATSQTMMMVWFRRPLAQVGLMGSVSSLYALVMVLHVMTWLMIGVVMLPTYVLLGLGSTCLMTNLLAIAISYYQTRQHNQPIRTGSFCKVSNLR
jgi:ABC-type Fe3+-siderophore transport system permease subunit